MIGNGSMPASAMRPANTETKQSGPLASALATHSTCSTVKSAVTFTLVPASTSRLSRSSVRSPLVLVTGILTLTLEPHVAICSAWRSISPGSSLPTSVPRMLAPKFVYDLHRREHIALPMIWLEVDRRGSCRRVLPAVGVLDQYGGGMDRPARGDVDPTITDHVAAPQIDAVLVRQ